MKNSKIFIILLGTFALLATGAVFFATTATSSSVITPSELASTKEDNLQRIRVAARVSNEPIDYRVEPSFELKFTVVDRPEKDEEIPSNAPHIAVEYQDIRPDNFQEGRDVLIDGDFIDGKIVASTIMTQCPSKYEPPSPEQG